MDKAHESESEQLKDTQQVDTDDCLQCSSAHAKLKDDGAKLL